MKETSTIKYLFVDDNEKMEKALANITEFDAFAVDFEMENNYHHYGLSIALIQISTPLKETYVFDPLAKEIDISPIGNLLSDEHTEKVIHDIDFDKRACQQVYGWTITNVFDTKVAAQLCGYNNYGLGSLLDEMFGLQTNKKYQKIDWLKRPINKDALRYAALETKYLHDIRDRLYKELKDLNRLEWAMDEFRFHELADISEPLTPYERLEKTANHQKLTARQKTLLKHLVEFREKHAKLLNRPVHFVIHDKLLIDISKNPPKNKTEVRAINSMHPVVYQQQTIKELLDVIKTGQRAPEIESIQNHRTRRRYLVDRPLKAMQTWRAEFAKPYEIEPYLLLSNETLRWAACEGNAKTVASEIAAQIRPWQRNLIWSGFAKEFNLPDL